MNATIASLIEKYGTTPDIFSLYAVGWEELRERECVAAKKEYCYGTGNNQVWPEGFAELVDNRIVYRGYYGNVLLAPAKYQPEVIITGAERERLYRESFE